MPTAGATTTSPMLSDRNSTAIHHAGFRNNEGELPRGPFPLRSSHLRRIPKLAIVVGSTSPIALVALSRRSGHAGQGVGLEFVRMLLLGSVSLGFCGQVAAQSLEPYAFGADVSFLGQAEKMALC